MTSRRAFLKLTFGSSAVMLLAACAPQAPAAKAADAPKPAASAPTAAPAAAKPTTAAVPPIPTPALGAPAAAKPAEAAKPAGAAPTTAPAAAAKPAGVPGGKLTIAYVPAATHIDVNAANISTLNEVAHYFHETLFDRSPDGKLVPLLVESEQVSPDGLTVTLKVRSGVKFHDGTPFNAAAVKWNLDRKITKKQPGADILPIKSIETSDDTTVKITLTRPAVSLYPWLSTKPFSMYSPTFAEKVGDDALKQSANGTGPFMVAEFRPNEVLVLKKNPDYWQKGLPYLDEITFRIVPNINSRAALLESGEVDMVLAPSLPDAMRLKETKGLKTVEGLGTQQYGMTINGKSGPLSDKKVRQALQYAVDKEGLIKTVMLGNASPAKSVYFTPNVSGAFDTGGYPYDANKAKALLDEAGWKPGADGIREKDGKKLSFGLLTRRGSVAGDFEIAELTQAMLKAVGMDMKIELMEAASYLPRLNRAGEPDYDMTNASNNTGSGDGEAIMETHYRSDAVPPRYYNYSWYSNPEVDKLTEQARSVPTLEERNKIYAQVQKIVVEDASWLLLFDVKQISVMKDDVQGVYLEPAGNNFPAKFAWRGKA